MLASGVAQNTTHRIDGNGNVMHHHADGNEPTVVCRVLWKHTASRGRWLAIGPFLTHWRAGVNLAISNCSHHPRSS